MFRHQQTQDTGRHRLLWLQLNKTIARLSVLLIIFLNFKIFLCHRVPAFLLHKTQSVSHYVPLWLHFAPSRCLDLWFMASFWARLASRVEQQPCMCHHMLLNLSGNSAVWSIRQGSFRLLPLGLVDG